MKIIVRNLARETTQAELLSLFSSHGRVQSCTLVMDQVTGGSKGFGFVNMPVPHEAKAAIRALNGLELGGSMIRVKKAETVKSAAEPTTGNDEISPGETGTGASVAADESVRLARIKKDGTPLGPRKSRVFSKKPGT